jgi:hypothetical protein
MVEEGKEGIKGLQIDKGAKNLKLVRWQRWRVINKQGGRGIEPLGSFKVYLFGFLGKFQVKIPIFMTPITIER